MHRRKNNLAGQLRGPEGSSLAVVGTKGRKGQGEQPWSVVGAFLRADFRISSRRVVYWFCLAWISPGWILESRVDAGAGSYPWMQEGCRDTIKEGVTIRDVELFRNGLGHLVCVCVSSRLVKRHENSWWTMCVCSSSPRPPFFASTTNRTRDAHSSRVPALSISPTDPESTPDRDETNLDQLPPLPLRTVIDIYPVPSVSPALSSRSRLSVWATRLFLRSNPAGKAERRTWHSART